MTSTVVAPNADKLSFFQSLARKLLHGQLAKLHTGCLVLCEGGEAIAFGEDESQARAKGLYAQIDIQDPACYADILTGGSIGAAEAYMTGDWQSQDLAGVMRILVRNMDILDQMEGGLALLSRPFLKLFHRFNQNTQKGSERNIAAHYDLGNELFRLFLDPKMMYSSGIYPSAEASLESAAEYKLEKICQVLQLNADDHVLEIGTGWGGFAIYAAQNYGCRVTTTTISKEQYALAKQRVDEAGVSDRVTLLLKDYRELEGQYDKLVSIEMIEAVGWKYYTTFFENCATRLKADGLMLIQAITITDQRYESARRNVDFIQRYIFPGSCIPSIQALMTASMKGSDLRLVQLQDFAEHYARTLRAWRHRCHDYREAITAQGYDETFQRMWEFYLAYCEGGFMERSIGVAHMVYAKPDFRDEQVYEVGQHELGRQVD